MIWEQLKVNFKVAYPVLLSMWWVFTVTFIIFPGTFFASHFEFMDKMKKDQVAWYNVTIILLFNILDTVGRKIGGFLNCPNKLIPILAFVRIVFVFTTYYIGHYDKKPHKGWGLW